MSYYYYILYTIYSISLQVTINQWYLIKIHFCTTQDIIEQWIIKVEILLTKAL